MAPLALAAALWTGGCELAPARGVQDRESCATAVTEYLQYSRTLATAEPSARARMHKEALAEYHQRPDTRNRVRLALAGSSLEPLPEDMDQTRTLFRELLRPDPQVLPPLEALLQMRLNEMESRLAAQKASAQQQAELDAARAKIQALTTIEKTLETPAGRTRGR